MKLENKYYVYLHINVNKQEPFYVGKGSGERAYKKGKIRSKFWLEYVNENGEYDIVILQDNLTEDEAFKVENYWICRIGRISNNNGPLINRGDGGRNNKGVNKGINNPMYGKKFTLEHRNNISNSLIGLFSGENHPNFGKKLSLETRNKISISNTGNLISDETRNKMKVNNSGEGNPKFKNKNSDLPCYISYSCNGKYMVRIKNKYIGVFNSIEDAQIKINDYLKLLD